MKDKLEILREKSGVYLKDIANHKNYGEKALEPAIKFANNAIKMDAPEFLEFLIKQEQAIMDVSDGKIIARSLFDNFLKRNDLEVSRDSWKLPRLRQWQSLYDDAFGGVKYE